MPSTTVHIPDELLAQVDQAARRRGTSRNRFVIDALREAVRREPGEWPPGFFDSELGPEESQLLAEAANEMEKAILTRRHSRCTTPL
jgi:hypothetical protein